MSATRRDVVALSAAAALAGAARPGAAASAQDTAPPLGPATPSASRVGLMFRPNHVALRVPNLDASVAWWERVFGARLVRRSRIGGIDPGAEIAFLHVADGFHVELVGGGDVREAAPPPADIAADYRLAGWEHVGSLVDDIDRAIAHLQANGVAVAYDTVRPDYGVHIVLIKEPNGHFVELYAPLS